MTTQSEPRDAVPIETRYTQRAEAAARAAFAAILIIDPGFSGATQAAKIEAAGRIAAALLLADREA